MTQKGSYRFSERTRNVIEKVKQTQEIRSNNKAIEYMIAEFDRRQSLSEELLSLYENRYGAELEALKQSTRAMEIQLAILVDLVNSLTLHFGLQNLSSVEFDPSPLYTQARESQRSRLARKKQIYDHKHRNYKE